ncbi:MAG: CpaF family protein [Bdellovibrionota bacterium]
MSNLERIHSLLCERGLSAADAGALALARAEAGASESELEEFFGHGPLAPFLAEEGVTEILVNGPGAIWVEREGQLEKQPLGFSSEESLRRYVRRLLGPLGRKVDPRAPFADAVIENGVRLHVAVPPISRQGICLSLRKPAKEPWTLDLFANGGVLSPAAVARLREFVAEKKNIFVCGGTGSGKTSLLGALLAEVPPTQRILALEDVAELRVNHPHFLSLEARPPNQEGEGELPLARLLRESLRMRPDRLVIGECRGPEALDLLMALNTGHRGSLGTIHANSARDALHRLETLALLGAENLREGAVKTLVASSIHVVVHLEKGPQGRRLTGIAEVKGLEGGNYLLKESRP